MIIGIDNGILAGIAVLNNDGSLYKVHKTPIRKILKYTKKASYMNIIVYKELVALLKDAKANNKDSSIKIYAERPMINFTRFSASMSAISAYVVQVMAFEEAKIAYEYVDSKEWQKGPTTGKHVGMLPSGIEGSEKLKAAAIEVASRLYPDIKMTSGLADSLLIAEFFRRRDLGLLPK